MTASLDSRDLVLMRALASEGGVTRAARALALSQSAVSHHLARLEAKLGVPLFAREGRGLRITPAGRRLAEGGGEVLEALEALERSLRPAEPARIRVTTQCGTAYDWLAPVLGRFARAHPRTRIDVKVGFGRDPLGALTEGKVDLALCHTAPGPGHVGHRLGEDAFVVVLPAAHPAASRPRVRPADLREDTLFVHDVPREELVALGKAWFGDEPPARTSVLPITEAMLELCAAGLGAAMMPAWAARRTRGRRDLVVRPFAKKSAKRTWRAVTRRADAERPDMRELVAELRAWFVARDDG
ncbi:MAG: LysR family transcriptional regulator [Myxococcota bacterium]